MKLMDPITGEFIRYATEDGAREIGDSPYAIEHFGAGTGSHAHPDVRRRPGRHVHTRDPRRPVPRACPRDVLRHGSRGCVNNPEILRRIIREGHTVGNHTLSHIDFDHESDFRNRQEIVADRTRHPGDGGLRHPALPHALRRPGQQPTGATGGAATRPDPRRIRPRHSTTGSTSRVRKCPSRRSMDTATSCSCTMPVADPCRYGGDAEETDPPGEGAGLHVHHARAAPAPAVRPAEGRPAICRRSRDTLMSLRRVWIAPGKVLTGMYWFGADRCSS